MAARSTMPKPQSSVPIGASAVIALVLLAYYLLIAPHATADGDSGELTLVLATGGVAHPTGYPLYTMLGHPFVAVLRALGVGYAFAANAWAAVGGAVALFFLHRLGLALQPRASQLTRARKLAIAALPVLGLGFNPQWTPECTLVEVNSWHVAWVCGATLLFVRMVQELADRSRPFPLTRRMLAWGLVVGVGGAHHSTAVFFAAGLTAGLAWALARAGQLRWRVPLMWLGAGIVPVLSYGYLYLRARHPGAGSVWPGLEPSLRGVVEHVSGTIYRGFLGSWRPDADVSANLAHDIYPFLWPGLLALAVGIALARHALERIALAAIVAASALELGFAYRYGVADPVTYFLAPLAMSLLGLAGLAHALLERWRVGNVLAGSLALALAAPLVVWGTRAALERRRDVLHYDEVIRSMWHAVPDGRGIFLWASDSYYKVRLYHELEGDKPDMDIYNTAMLCQPYPEERFRMKYGFDPLANNGPEHAREWIEPRFIPEHHVLIDDRFLSRVNKTIADSARVPVVMFNGSAMRLKRLN